MKQFFMTVGHERDLVRYSETSDQKDAKAITDQEAKERLLSLNYSENKAEPFLAQVKKNPFNDWIIY